MRVLEKISSYSRRYLGVGLFVYAIILLPMPWWLSLGYTGLMGLLLVLASAFQWEVRGAVVSSAWATAVSLLSASINHVDPIHFAVGTLAYWVVGLAVGFTIRRVRAADKELLKYKAAVDQTIDGVALSDMEGNIRFVNQAWAGMHGFRIEEPVDQHLRMFHTREQLENEVQPFTEVLLQTGANSGEVNHRRKDGTVFLTWMTTTVIHDDHGQPLGLLAIARDITERKQMEESLRNREDLLRKTQAIAHLGSWELDTAADRLVWSDEVYRIFGLQPQQFAATYEAFLETVHPDDREKVHQAYTESIQKASDDYDIEHRIVRPGSGEVRHVHEKCVHVRDSRGNVVRSTGMVHDITERKQAERALEANRNLLDSVFQSIQDGISVLDSDLRIVAVNHTMQSLYEYAGPIIGKKCYEVYHNRAKPCTVCPTLAALEQKTVCSEIIPLRIDGRQKGWLEVFAYPMIDPSTQAVTGVVEFIRDITERKKMENALRESERNYAEALALVTGVIESSDDIVIFALDHEYRYLTFNANHQATMKHIWNADISVGTNMLDYITNPADREQAKTHFDRALNGEAFSMIEPYGDTALDRRWYENIYNPLRNSEGTIIGLTLFLTDITERKQAEEKLAAYTTELELRESELNALYRMLDREMKSARDIHQRLLQLPLPSIEGIALAAACTPATYIGGDFSQVIRKENRMVVYVSDATGHGLDATMFSLFVKTSIDAFVALTPADELAPRSILRHLDAQVREGRFPSEYAVALFVMVIDLDTKELTYSAAGFQNAPLLGTEADGLEPLAARGLLISRSIPDEVVAFEQHRTVLPDNAFLFLATDGLYEQLNSANEMYEQRLTALLRTCHGLSEQTIVDLVQMDFDEFCGSNDQADDTTLVVLSTSPTEAFSVPSTFAALEKARERVERYYAERPDREAIAMAVHELVTNAIEHGNQLDDAKSVYIQLDPRSVVVEDEGEGFDWKTTVHTELSLDSDEERGRGIAMTQMLVGKLVFNEKGNRVSLLIGG